MSAVILDFWSTHTNIIFRALSKAPKRFEPQRR